MGNGLTRADKTENGGRPSMSTGRFPGLHLMLCCGRKVRPTADRAKSANQLSAGSTKEQIASDINKAKASTKRHQRYKSKQKGTGQEQEQPTTKSKSKSGAGGVQERASKSQKSKSSKPGDPNKRAERKKKRSGGSAANGEAAAP